MTTLHMYSKTHCQQCRAVERWLDARGIEYTYTNLDHLSESEADEILAELKADGHQSAPVLYFSHEGKTTSVAGFNPIALGEIHEQLQAVPA